MKRRNLIRGVATSSLLALGVASASGIEADAPYGGATHMKVRRDDGSYEVMPMEEFLDGPDDYNPPCDCGCYCCSNCDCACGPCYVC